MDTVQQTQAQAQLLATTGRYIASNHIGTRDAQLYLLNDHYFIIWYKRSINFVSVSKVEEVSGNTAKMLFEY